MKRPARVVGLVSYLNAAGQRICVPAGPCSFDEGPHGMGPYILSWVEHDVSLAVELTLDEYARYVAAGNIKIG